MATLTAQQIAALAAQAGVPSAQLVTAVAVCLAESSGRTEATHRNSNGSTDYGLWQINSVHGIPASTLLTPAGNAAAMMKFSNGGTTWRPWSAYTNGAAATQRVTAAAGVSAYLTGARAGGTNATNAGFSLPGPVDLYNGFQSLNPWRNDGGTGLMPNLPGPWQVLPDMTGSLDSIAKSFATIAAWSLQSVDWWQQPRNWGRVLLVLAGGSVAVAGLVMLAESDATPAVAGEAVKAGKAAAATAVATAAKAVV